MKKRLLVILSIVFIAIAVLVATGPRVNTQYTYTGSHLPDDLDSFIQEQESRFSDITPGTEKRILWAGEPGARTPFSLVYLHGFSSSRQDIAPLSENIARNLGANLYETRFSGHGRPGDAMKEVTVNDWLNDARQAYEIGAQLGEQVILIGLSTGGTYALWLAAQPETEQLAAVTLISPNMGPAIFGTELLLLPWGEELGKLVEGDYRNVRPVNKAHGKYWTTRYPIEAVVTMMGAVEVTRDQPLEQIKVPILTIYSENDRTVDVSKIESMVERLPDESDDILIFSSSTDRRQHVLAGDVLSPGTTEPLVQAILEFITTETDAKQLTPQLVEAQTP